MTEKKEFETRIDRMRLGEDGIVRITSLPQIEITLDDAKISIEAQLKVTKGKSCPTLLDIREIKSITRKARMYFAGKESRSVNSAMGILVNSPLSKMVGNLFIGINKPDMPTKLFLSEDKAIEWLKRYIE